MIRFDLISTPPSAVAARHQKHGACVGKRCGCNFALTSRIIEQPNGGTHEVPCYLPPRRSVCISPQMTRQAQSWYRNWETGDGWWEKEDVKNLQWIKILRDFVSSISPSTFQVQSMYNFCRSSHALLILISTNSLPCRYLITTLSLPYSFLSTLGVTWEFDQSCLVDVWELPRSYPWLTIELV